FFTHSQVVWRDEATGVVEAFKTPLYGRGFRNPALNNVGRGSSLKVPINQQPDEQGLVRYRS
ncbi:MAG TPA: hypothetical protein V6D26_30335, partial [Stenomitos sp.]